MAWSRERFIGRVRGSVDVQTSETVAEMESGMGSFLGWAQLGAKKRVSRINLRSRTCAFQHLMHRSASVPHGYHTLE